MLEVFKLLIGIGVLILGYPIGNFLANYTKEELAGGQIYFKALTFIGLLGGLLGLILGNDALLFTMFFIAIVSSRSVKRVGKKKPKKKVRKKK